MPTLTGFLGWCGLVFPAGARVTISKRLNSIGARGCARWRALAAWERASVSGGSLRLEGWRCRACLELGIVLNTLRASYS